MQSIMSIVQLCTGGMRRYYPVLM